MKGLQTLINRSCWTTEVIIERSIARETGLFFVQVIPAAFRDVYANHIWKSDLFHVEAARSIREFDEWLDLIRADPDAYLDDILDDGRSVSRDPSSHCTSLTLCAGG